MKLAYVTALLAVGLAVGSARASNYTLVDNFSGDAIGADASLGGVAGWTTGGNDGTTALQATVVAAPGAPGGATQALQLYDSGANMSVYNNSPAVTLPTGGAAGTIFFSIFASDQTVNGLAGEGLLGMTDNAAPASFGDFRGLVMFGDDGDAAGASAATGKMGVGVYANTATNTGSWDWANDVLATQGQWYNIWEVYRVDGTGVTGGVYDVYIQGGTEFPMQTLLESGVYYRGSTLSGPLTTLGMLSDDPAPTLFTNIYVDTTGDSHLVNPTAAAAPEPASLALLGLGVLGLFARKRR